MINQFINISIQQCFILGQESSVHVLNKYSVMFKINPFTAIGTACAIPIIFGVFAIWTAFAVSIIIITRTATIMA
jgi:hypothetical protein